MYELIQAELNNETKAWFTGSFVPSSHETDPTYTSAVQTE